jgi:hypothetical protein
MNTQSVNVKIYKNVEGQFYYYGKKLSHRDLHTQTVSDEDVAFDLVSKLNKLEKANEEKNNVVSGSQNG